MGQEIPNCSSCLKKKDNDEFLANTGGGTDVSQHSNIINEKPIIKTQSKISSFKHLNLFNNLINLAINPQQSKREILIQKMYRGYKMRNLFTKSLKSSLIEEEKQFITTQLSQYEQKYNVIIKNLNKIFQTKFKFLTKPQPTQDDNKKTLFNCKLLIRQKDNITTLFRGKTNINLEYEGNGELYSSKGYKLEGEFKNGEFTGYGKMYTIEGDLLEGHFISGKLEGDGHKVSLDLTIYTGKFKNGFREGKGVEETPEHIYTGEFKGDNKHGQGKVKYKLYKDIYQGEFKDNAITGYGLYIWENHHTYQGELVNGKMHGKGLYKWPEGGEYEGEYVNGIKEGKGIFTWEDGKIFKGPFTNGKPHGKGILIFNDTQIDVEFVNGKLNKDILQKCTSNVKTKKTVKK